MGKISNLWLTKRKYFIFLIAVVMIVVFFISFLNTFKEEEIVEVDEYKPYESMHNASRYFFRVFYPDDWDVETGTYGFMLDKEQNLVLEMFPLKEIEATPTPENGTEAPNTQKPTVEPSATLDPREGMERDELYTMYFYYKEYDPIYEDLKALEKTKENENSDEIGISIQDAATGKTTAESENELKAPVSNEILAEYVFDKFIESKDSEQYTFDVPFPFVGDEAEFMVLPFNYIENDINMSGELYVTSRGMAYYEILVLGTNSYFAKFDAVKDNIIHNIKLSVFDY